MSTQRALSVALLVVVLTGVVGAYVEYRDRPSPPTITQGSITEGDIVESVIATGTLQAMRTVLIGTEVSGTVSHVAVDFNSLVHTGQVLAEIDPSAIQAQLNSAKAMLDAANITRAGDAATLDTDQKEFTRMTTLFGSGLETEQDRDSARVLMDEDRVKVDQDKDAVRIAQSSVDSSALDLSHCTITSPIDGVVLARTVDEGQTVTSRMETPTLFTLATDLVTLQLVGDVDESDISRVRPGQPVHFTVDAYPDRIFDGVVTASRLNATNTNNVVTYQTVISVANPDRRLLPSMTASFRIETARATHVARVANAAVRFTPLNEVLAAFGEAPAASRRGAPTPVTAATSASSTAPVAMPVNGRIDRMFGPVPAHESAGQVWRFANNRLTPQAVRLGLTDGTWTQLLGDDLHVGDQIVMNAVPGRTSGSGRR